MTAPAWLIESGVYGPEAEPLAAEVRRRGMRCEWVTPVGQLELWLFSRDGKQRWKLEFNVREGR